ncbi:aldo/keto reductase [Marinimicrobium sp. ABcell2]|uniref:aldo/keto reductase n=1 Tax=Marinimicrobium sp. ABcell2 TaxID=3069751 RepID=UPI0027B536B1|nr:aldo/keto reductase [Marinimicrobium sp. ABcell2]MDQ2077220.1 aldo/keto reductase [Marinimicrobium sp. ABcell2]
MTGEENHKRKRQFGRSDVFTSLLGFGSAPIGNLYRAVTESTASQAVHCALDSELDYFDTAPHYGFGLSETRLGAALKARHATPVLSTKVGRLLEPLAEQETDAVRHGFADAPKLEPVFDYSYDGVMRSFEASLARLGREHVDILLAHDLGEVTHGEQHPQRWREFMDGGYKAMVELRDSGLVGALGLGANEWQICAQALEYGEFDGFLLAGRYTLLEQGAVETFLPLCAERGASVILGGPFNSGILATGVSGPGPHHYNYEPAPEEVITRVARIEAVCRQLNVPLAAAALQFPAAHPQVCSVLAGLANAEEVTRAVELMNWPLPAELWQTLRAEGLLHPSAPTPESTNLGSRNHGSH